MKGVENSSGIKQKVIQAFYDLRPENTDPSIAKFLGMNTSVVSKIITDHLDEKLMQSKIKNSGLTVGQTVNYYDQHATILSEESTGFRVRLTSGKISIVEPIDLL